MTQAGRGAALGSGRRKEIGLSTRPPWVVTVPFVHL